MIDNYQIFGERRSGTNYLANLLRKNFSGIRETTKFGGKHWFIKDHQPRGLENQTTDRQCEIPLEQSDHTLFLVIYRNPYDWLRSINLKPFHADGHWNLPFSEFIRKPWISYTTEKLNSSWRDNENNYFFIEKADNVMVNRSMKIRHFLALDSKVKNICHINYEHLLSDIDLLAGIAEEFKIQLKHPFIKDMPFRMGDGIAKRQGFIETQYESCTPKDMEFINQQLDWDLERSIGYRENQTRYTKADFERQSPPIGIKTVQHTRMNNDPSTPHGTVTISSEIELTVYIRNMDPLTLYCDEDLPIVKTLFQALLKNRGGEGQSDQLLYLQIGQQTPKAIYFPASNLVSIETNPPVSESFLSSLME